MASHLKALSWFIFLSAVVQFGSFTLAKNDQNNLFVLHLYVPIGGTLLVWFYRELFKEYLSKNIFLMLGAFLIGFSLINTLFFQAIWTFNTNALVAEAIVMVTLSLSAFVLTLYPEYYKNRKTDIVTLNWLNSGLFLYYSGNLLLYYYGDLIVASTAISVQSWLIHSFLISGMHTCFIVGLWKAPKR